MLLLTQLLVLVENFRHSQSLAIDGHIELPSMAY